MLTEFPKRRITLPNAGNRESVTIIEAISAGGESIPAMLILSGKTHNASWFRNLHDGTLVGVTETGYSNDEFALEWIAHFDRFSKRSQLGAKRLLCKSASSQLVDRYVAAYSDPNPMNADGLKLIAAFVER